MKAYELIDKPERWCKGAYSKIGPNGIIQYCLLGAINRAYDSKPFEDRIDAVLKVESAVPNIREGIYAENKVIKWNDHPDRTYEDVYNLLKELDI